MQKKRIVIVGSNFAGFNAAVALKERLRSRHDVTVIARLDHFVFRPSLVRIALGARTVQQASFPVRPPLAELGIAFRHESVIRLDLGQRKVITRTTEERYDFLVIATGAKPNYAAVPGLGPRGYTQSLSTLAGAEQARVAFETLLGAPGPVVVGDVHRSGARDEALELVVNLARRLRQHGLADRAPITHLSSGPAAAVEGITALGNATVSGIAPNQIRLGDGRVLPFAYALLVPPFLGADPVRACVKITDAQGFVRVNAFNQTEAYPEVFAAGAAVAGAAEKSGCLAEQMAERVAHNIEARIRGEPMEPGLPHVDRAADAPLESDGGWCVPGPCADWGERAFKRYFPAAA